MTSRRVRAAGLLGAAWASLVPFGLSADDGNGLSRTLELPAHRALMHRIGLADTELAPFTTDGCSGGMSGAWQLVADTFPEFESSFETAPPWEACCVTHDRAYHNAGGAPDAAASYDARLAADRALEVCVQQTGTARRKEYASEYDVTPDQVDGAFATIAGAMFLAVRFGGAPCSGLPWRWGYGYPQCSILTDRDD